jgi:hypothetical protein
MVRSTRIDQSNSACRWRVATGHNAPPTLALRDSAGGPLSWHEQFESRTPAVVLQPDLTDAKSVWRKARAREALLLAMYLTKIKATTLSLFGRVGSAQNQAIPKHNGKPKVMERRLHSNLHLVREGADLPELDKIHEDL